MVFNLNSLIVRCTSNCKRKKKITNHLLIFIILSIDYLLVLIRVSDPHFFLADPDPDPAPGKNLHADPDPVPDQDPVPDPDPGGIRVRGLGVKGNMIFFLSFFHVSDDS